MKNRWVLQTFLGVPIRLIEFTSVNAYEVSIPCAFLLDMLGLSAVLQSSDHTLGL